MRCSPVVLLTLVCASSVHSCARPGEPARGVIHLDLRLDDGRSSAEVLGAWEDVFERREAGASAASLAPWVVTRGELSSVEEGLVLESRDEGKQHAQLAYREPIDAARVDRLELDLGPAPGLVLRLTWRRTDTASSPLPLERRFVRGEPATFELSRHPEWRGAIDELLVDVSWDRGKNPVLRSISLTARGFQTGFEPLDGEAASDGGLVPLGLDALRAWPADLGDPLLAGALVPRGGRLSVSVAAAFAGALPEQGAACVVEVREAEGRDWQRVAEVVLTASTNAPAWKPLTADLAEWGGREIDLRFLAAEPIVLLDGSWQYTSGARRERARVLWGEPLVIGDLPDDPRPNVLLVTLDTTRADHVGDSTPTIDRLGREGITFENAWSACNATTPSHASILTGLHVLEHGATGNRNLLGAEHRTLAEELREEGFATAAAVSVGHLQAGTGLGQGFDRFRQAHPEANVEGRHTVEAALGWLEEWDGDRPFFLWVHLFDPHTPYGPPAEFLEAWTARTGIAAPPREVTPETVPALMHEASSMEWVEGISNLEHVRFLYRAGVAYADELLGRLVGKLEDQDVLARTLVLVTADHGEALSEHSVWFDHRGLFREVMHVPLVMRLPDAMQGRVTGSGRDLRVDARVSTLDIFPTVVSLLGLEPVRGVRGIDLTDVLAGRTEADRRLWFEHSRIFQLGTSNGSEYFITTVRDGMSYGPESTEHGGRNWVSAPRGTHHLFDESHDPRLADDLAGDRPERIAELLKLVQGWRDGLEDTAPVTRDVSTDEETRLQAMGYAGDD